QAPGTAGAAGRRRGTARDPPARRRRGQQDALPPRIHPPFRRSSRGLHGGGRTSHTVDEAAARGDHAGLRGRGGGAVRVTAGRVAGALRRTTGRRREFLRTEGAGTEERAGNSPGGRGRTGDGRGRR